MAVDGDVVETGVIAHAKVFPHPDPLPGGEGMQAGSPHHKDSKDLKDKMEWRKLFSSGLKSWAIAGPFPEEDARFGWR